MLIGQLTGRKYRWGNKNAGKREAHSAVMTQLQRKQGVIASPKMVPSHIANIDKNHDLI